MQLQPCVADAISTGQARFLQHLIQGLSAPLKTLPCKYLYDERGSQLFERIGQTEEYYPTRTELAIVRENIEQICERIGPRVRLVELGSGSGLKTRLLLGFLDQVAAYVPVDLSRSAMERCVQAAQIAFPHVDVLPVYADFTERWALPACLRPFERTLIYYPGSTIGNFEPREAQSFLERLRPLCRPTGGLLVGVDLKKDRAILEAAYNDAQGVTAAFNLNLLERANRELGTDFDTRLFEHRAFYDPERGRIEMHLVSRTRQLVHAGALQIPFEEGEPIVTEYSYKYGIDEFEALITEAGFRTAELWTDDDALFSLWHLEAIEPS